jgi:hypothetical protein
MPTRNAEAVWEGDLKSGKGTMLLAQEERPGYAFSCGGRGGAGSEWAEAR